MKFSKLDGLLKVTASMPIRMHADFDLDIPATSGDVLDMDVLPTDAMSAALKSIANKGSAAGLTYALEGRIAAIPEKASQSRDFQFKGDGWLSPVPGLVNTYR